MNYAKAILAYLITFLIIDAVWINAFAINLYNRDVGALMADTPRVLPALVFYLGYAAAAVYLIVRPAKKLSSVALNGAVLGAMAYGTFAVSNYALLASWTPTLLIVDTLFGTLVTAVCCCVSFKLSAFQQNQ